MRFRLPSVPPWACLVPLLVACGEPAAPQPEPPPAHERPNEARGLAPAPPIAPWAATALEGLDLPRAGTVGAMPEGASMLTLAADGRMRIDGVACDYAGVTARLARRSEQPGARESSGASCVDLCLATDRATPWRLVQWAMEAAAHPEARVHRVHFVVRPEAGGAPGALATFLPEDRDPRATRSVGGVPRVAVRLREDGVLDEATLYARLRAAPEPARVLRPLLDADETAPCGVVLRVVDLVFRAGFAGVVFQGAPPPRFDDEVASVVARARAETRPACVVVDGGQLERAAVGEVPPPGALVAGRPAGDWSPARCASPAERGSSATTEMAAPEAPPEEDLPPTPEPLLAPDWAVEEEAAAPTTWADQVEPALRWLRAQQRPDGGWSAAGYAKACDGKPYEGTLPMAGDPSREVGVTALALLSLLAGGYSDRSEGPGGSAVFQAARFLCKQQAADGTIGPRTGAWLTDHAWATLALAGLYGATGGSAWRAPVAAAARALWAQRRASGAWGSAGPSGPDCVRTSAWVALALRSLEAIAAAEAGRGGEVLFPVPEDALPRLLAWVEPLTERETGRFFGPRDDHVSGAAATAAALAIRAAAREPADGASYAQGVEFLRANPPRVDTGYADLEGWFWTTLAAFYRGGPAWEDVEKRLRVVLRLQDRSGTPCDGKGSWDPIRDQFVGRVGATALGSFCAAYWGRYPKAPGYGLDLR